MAVIFITGTSGAGKSTLKKQIENLNFVDAKLHDFDEIGVPEFPDLNWRIQASREWLEYCKENEKNNINTIIFGQTAPEEINSLANEIGLDIFYGFIDVQPKDIRERLTERGWPEDLIEANVNWSVELKRQLKEQKNFHIYEAFESSVKETAEHFLNWIKMLLK